VDHGPRVDGPLTGRLRAGGAERWTAADRVKLPDADPTDEQTDERRMLHAIECLAEDAASHRASCSPD